jgi:hypothetical protein
MVLESNGYGALQLTHIRLQVRMVVSLAVLLVLMGV